MMKSNIHSVEMSERELGELTATLKLVHSSLEKLENKVDQFSTQVQADKVNIEARFDTERKLTDEKIKSLEVNFNAIKGGIRFIKGWAAGAFFVVSAMAGIIVYLTNIYFNAR